MRKNIILIVVAILVVGFLVWKFWGGSQSAKPSATAHAHSHGHGCHGHGHSHSHDHGDHDENVVMMPQEQIASYDIQVQKAQAGVLSMNLSTRGRIVLHPDKLAHIIPKVSGVAKEVRANIGGEVKKGDILAVLESRDMADLKANYLASLEKANLALSLFERENRLYEKKISAEQDFLNAQSAYEEAKINVHLAKQKLNAFGLADSEINLLATQENPNLSLYQIRSPLDGVVINRHITHGELIENSATIFEIADLSKVWVEIGIYPKDIWQIKKGQTVYIGEKETEAKIIYVSPIVEDETITAKAVAELINLKGEWKPGTFVQASIDTEVFKSAMVIPQEALQEIEGKNYVFIRVPQGFEKRAVQVGKRDQENVEVLAGLNVGEPYASTQTFLLKADLGKGDVEHEH